MKFSEDVLKRIEALAPKDLSATLAKYVMPDKLFCIRAGDFGKKTAPSGQSQGG